MSTRLWGRPTGASPIVSARHSSFPRAWSPNEARWEPRRGVTPELLLDRTALRGRQRPAHRLDETLIARGPRPPQEPMPQPTVPPSLGPAAESSMMMNRWARRPPEQPEPARTSLPLRRKAHSPRTDQPGIGGLETPESPADCPHQVDVLIVGAAEGEVGCCGVIVRYRNKTENDSTRVDLNNAAETE